VEAAVTLTRVQGSQEFPADVATIEQEFAAVWRAAGGDAARNGRDEETSPGGQPVTRASSLNLIVPCREECADEVQHVLAELVGAHPARVLLLLLEPESTTSSLTASVSAFCRRLDSAPGQLCCEWITLRARGSDTRHVPEAVLPLLEPDLPAVAWWPGGISLDEKLLERLGGLAHRWIVDSSSASEPGALQQIVRLSKGVLADLAWMRLMTWRELTAQFFDPPVFRPCLPEIDFLEATATTSEGAPRPGAEALLWIAWLAERLGWGGAHSRDRKAAETLWTFPRPRGEGKASIRLTAGDRLPPGDIVETRLVATGAETAFTITRGTAGDVAMLAVETTGACPLPRAVGLRRPRPAQLLGAALDAHGRDPLYAAAISLAAQLMDGGAG
jgi:glucose-6-phosphate dehydrogenase assembly protein OpcA